MPSDNYREFLGLPKLHFKKPKPKRVYKTNAVQAISGDDSPFLFPFLFFGNRSQKLPATPQEPIGPGSSVPPPPAGDPGMDTNNSFSFRPNDDPGVLNGIVTRTPQINQVPAMPMEVAHVLPSTIPRPHRAHESKEDFPELNTSRVSTIDSGVNSTMTDTSNANPYFSLAERDFDVNKFWLNVGNPHTVGEDESDGDDYLIDTGTVPNHFPRYDQAFRSIQKPYETYLSKSNIPNISRHVQPMPADNYRLTFDTELSSDEEDTSSKLNFAGNSYSSGARSETTQNIQPIKSSKIVGDNVKLPLEDPTASCNFTKPQIHGFPQTSTISGMNETTLPFRSPLEHSANVYQEPRHRLIDHHINMESRPVAVNRQHPGDPLRTSTRNNSIMPPLEESTITADNSGEATVTPAEQSRIRNILSGLSLFPFLLNKKK